MTRKPTAKTAAKRIPQKPPAAKAIPGLEAALGYLRDPQDTGSLDPRPIKRATRHDGADADGIKAIQAAWELRNPPQDLLNALTLLRLHAMLTNAGATSLLPPRGSLQVIVVAASSDQTLVKSMLPRLMGHEQYLHDPSIHLEKDDKRHRSPKDFLESIRSALLRGDPVIAVLSSGDMVPDDLRIVMQPPLQLPPLTRGMLEAVMAFHFEQPSIELAHPDHQISRLSDVSLAAVFSAEDAETAIARLDRATSPKINTGVTLDDVHGQPQAVGALKQVVQDLEDFQDGKVAWAEVTKSFLLLGPPGTGKTMLAEALAGSSRVEFVKTSYSDCQRHGHQGDMLRELNNVVERAITAAPSVFFIDEIDSFHSRNTKSNNGYIIGVVNGLLTQLDRLSATPGVVLIAATNDRSRVDDAVIRAGRFDRHIRVSVPDRSGIHAMLEKPLFGLKLDPVDFDMLCDQLLGLSGAEIAAMIRDARTRARAERTSLSFGHLRAAADAIRPRVEHEFMWRIAVHEAGHLFAGHLLRLPAAHDVRIELRNAHVLRPYPTLRLPDTMHRLICMHLAGRIAEETVFLTPCDGSGNGPDSDLAQATRAAVEAECACGFGKSLTWIDPDTPVVVLPQRIQERVEARLVAAGDHIRRLFSEHRSDLERIGRVLLEQREMDAAAIAALMSTIPRNPSHAQDDTFQNDTINRGSQTLEPSFKENPYA